ncbi:MAG: DUF2252 domain-containing protein [Solirubrobacterales bacterium]|nr:DUF2252 domain-containing protein [Solirubrobacterales bacterium]
MKSASATSTLTQDSPRFTGKELRKKAARESHAEWDPAPGRDPLKILLAQGKSRVQDLLPIRYGRMSASPFAFYRGGAAIMAADLAPTPVTGVMVQACGDAHISNFGGYAAPDRSLVFDLNDFDETLPGPFEWDVKRLVTSLEVAARANAVADKERRRILVEAGAAYREAMRTFADQPLREVWYGHVRIDAELAAARKHLPPDRFAAMEKILTKARSRDTAQAMKKLTTVTDGERRILSDPPLVVPIEELFPDRTVDEVYDALRGILAQYAGTLPSNRRHLLHQYRLVQVARKVVGVGSVGTQAWVLLLESRDGTDWLFLQAKEAQESVLAPYAGASAQDNQGERVVAGQLLMQAVSDPFLGWQRAQQAGQVQRDYYVRQLRDWKASLPVEQMLPSGLELYGKLCATTLARAHARSGNRVSIAAYLGKSDRFEKAIAAFAEAYADLNDRDHATLVAAIADGRLPAAEG